jgi:cysteine desulfuration protein SufE
MTINEIQDQLIEDFSMLPSWEDKYEYMMELGKELPLIDIKYKDDEHLIPGCQSRAWIQTELVDGKMQFTADCEALIAKGIVALILKVLSNQPPEDIVNSDLYLIDEIGLSEHLSMSRAEGLKHLLDSVRDHARQYL